MGQLLWVLLNSRQGGTTALGKTEFSEYFPPIFPSTLLSPFSSSDPNSLSSLPANLALVLFCLSPVLGNAER